MYRRGCGRTVFLPFCFYNAVIFDLAYQSLQSIDYMGTDIAADQNVHDIVADGELSFVEPDSDIVDAVHPVGLFNGGVHLL